MEGQSSRPTFCLGMESYASPLLDGSIRSEMGISRLVMAGRIIVLGQFYNQGPRARYTKNQKVFTPITTAVKGHSINLAPDDENENGKCMFISKRKDEPSHYMLKIESFSLLSEAPTTKIESDVFEASGHKWRLDLYANGNEEEKGGNHISLYVIICGTESLPKGWEVYVDVHFFIYDHMHHNYATFQDTVNGNRTRFHEKKMKWGFDKLISLESFNKSENGYLVNDSCVFGAEVFAVTVYAQKDRILSMTKPPELMSTHTWTIENFLTVTENDLYSEIFKVGKVKWYISIYSIITY
ncbi:hypothetical protein L6452_28068 [Arctium lappa]|uniref:Uncharacterized protein n=1 Tax=Arctium lappa TaxID=4217 RepID=A0ACB8ZYS7_ARCLA|nr:hypothetical protein L6452_28068 [Arctium lappa]